jgi:hypothetical protein
MNENSNTLPVFAIGNSEVYALSNNYIAPYGEEKRYLPSGYFKS